MTGALGDIAAIYAQLPLTPTGNIIRVLHILPGLWLQKVKVTLKTIDISLGPQYEALSYTWGASSLNRSIVVNDIYELPVTGNLFNALRRLRFHFSTRVLWVDKVCINQDDLEERPHQVAIMAVIYGHATAVNVWLGEHGCTFPLNLKFRLPSKARIVGWNLHRWMIWLRVVRNHHTMMNRAILATSPHWHERAWTVQEFIVARKVYLCYGRMRTLRESSDLDFMREDCLRSSWQKLSACVALHHRINDLSVHNYRLRGNEMDLAEFRARFSQLGYEPNVFGILDLKISLNLRDATDRRDQVYSLLGRSTPTRLP